MTIGPLGGRHAVVTGAAGGIGSAVVRSLLAQGALVHGLDRDLAGQQRLVAEVNTVGRFVAHEIDLTDRPGTDRAIADLLGALAGRCDILVNNAGVSCLRSFAETDDALLDFLLAVNFAGAFRVTRALLGERGLPRPDRYRHAERGVCDIGCPACSASRGNRLYSAGSPLNALGRCRGDCLPGKRCSQVCDRRRLVGGWWENQSMITNPVPWPDGAKCAVAFTFDMDAESILHLAHPKRAHGMVCTASMLCYGPCPRGVRNATPMPSRP
jgi:short chain dehydrogenase